MAQIDLFPDFRELFESLNLANVKYLLVGGYAVNHYGYHRVTGDIDVWISTDPENAVRLARAMEEFCGFEPGQIKDDTFQKRGSVFMFGVPPRRIDLLTDPSGVSFEVCYQRKAEVEWDGVLVPIISLDDLRANKLASGRVKDMADLERLNAELPPSKQPE